MSATKKTVLDKAASQIGYVESPAGTNRTKYGRWYGMNGVPWCAIFISWVAAMCNALDIIPRHAYTPSGAAWFKARKLWHTSGPKSGDIAYFDFPGDGVNRISHVAIVESVRPDGMVVTIEGNTSTGDNRNGGMVMRRVRNPKYIVGYGRPRYKPAVRPYPGRPIGEGDHGADVLWIKKRLKVHGYTGFDLASDVFGNGTAAAVLKFRRDLWPGGKPEVPVVGSATWRELSK